MVYKAEMKSCSTSQLTLLSGKHGGFILLLFWQSSPEFLFSFDCGCRVCVDRKKFWKQKFLNERNNYNLKKKKSPRKKKLRKNSVPVLNKVKNSSSSFSQT